ncbi:hypothetical protein ACHAXR_011085 [Thalassiosira sp. AJA248-18]
MNEVDDLQSFITDCEWKTRKILRESNKRMKDNARSLAAKERVEKLKHNGSVGKSGLKTKLNTPLAKSKSLNRSVQKLNTPNKKTITPVKEWKGRDKIIHDAYETIKSFPVDKKSLKANARKDSLQTEKTHSSLSASPFRGPKGSSDSIVKPKQKSRLANANADSDADNLPENGEPAMVTRRTIERDFYIMSKKRNNPPSKRRQQSAKQNEPTPELKTSVLRKKYRCDEQIMKAKRKRADRLNEKLKRLKIPIDGIDGMANTDDSDSSVSSDDEDYIHSIHDLVERHVEDENFRSLKRSNKMLMNTTFKPDVKDFWAHLQRNSGGTAILSNGQVPSVPLHIATKQFDSNLGGTNLIGENVNKYTFGIEQSPVSRYISPYKPPNYAKLKLIANEPLAVPLIDRTTLLSVSISILHNKTTEPDSLATNLWMYEIYDPCNGSARNFILSDVEFDSMNMSLNNSITNQPETELIKKIVYHETGTDNRGGKCTFIVLVSAHDLGITSKLYRSDGHNIDGLDSICTQENLIVSLRVCEVLQLLKKHQVYSVFDMKFWLNDFNGMTIWKPLIQMFQDNTTATEDELSLMAVATKACDSFLALRNTLNRAPNNSIGEAIDMIQQQSSATHELWNEDERDAPLSMRISGCSPFLDTVCPGHASIGKCGVWRLSERVVEEDTDSMLPTWPSLMNIKYPECLDNSQASAFFHYKTLGAQKGDCVSVLSSLAFESPILAPYCFAIDKGYISPPFVEHESLTGIIPYVHLPCTSLLENPVESRLDTLLPPPVVVLDPGASEDDWKDAPRNADGQVYHCHELSKFDRDGFWVKTTAHRVEYDDTISSMVYGISEKAASPNRPTTTSFLTHTSDEACTQCLTRNRTAADYHYIAESDGEGTLSEPYLFSTHMSSYSSVFVSRKSISSYREQERFLHATKEAERKKLDQALKMKAAEELVEERLKERIAKIEHSLKAQEDLASISSEKSVAIELPSSADDVTIPNHDEKIPCDVELPTPPSDLVDVDESNELEQLANLLLTNSNFLKAVARKLNISEDQVMQIDATIDEGNGIDLNRRQTSSQRKTNVVEDEHDKSCEEVATNPALRQTSLSASTSMLEDRGMPKLKLNCKRYRDSNVAKSRGDGWKRLPRNETVIGDFSLTKRNVQRGSGEPKFKKLNDNRNFIAVNAVQELRYKTDPQQFATEPKSLFISDLTTERLQLGKTYRQQKKAKESMLSVSQQQSLDEILQIPVSDKSEKGKEDETAANLDAHVDECDDAAFENEARPMDHVSRAILAVKNHNLPELEYVLDTEGLSVETRDQHGNTLFILACQQGSKKLAKFLLRRGANRNAQNNGGNSALHYLYEYKHTSLAEYLIRKGADDSIKNGEGLTVYEGLIP